MPAILVRFAAYLLGSFLGGLTFKAFVLAAIWWIFSEGIEVVVALLPLIPNVQAGISALPVDAYWLLDLAQLEVGAPLIVAAYMTRFMVRRIPVVG